jgi:hypothetical protein
VGALVVVVVGVPAVIGIRPIIGPKVHPLSDRRFEPSPQRLERGRYLVTAVNGCVYCHSELDWNAPGFPVKAGTEGGGRSWAEEGMPWLTAANITPDRETGVGKWTDDMLARAIREGISRDGRALFPLMPYHQYKYMSDADIASVIVYLRSLEPLSLTGPYGQVASSNITPAPSGIPYYTEELFLEVMRTGMAKARKIHGAMPWIGYGKQTDNDLKSILAFLQTVGPVAHRVDNSLTPTACPRCGARHGAGDQNQLPSANPP